jgi:sarcosine oxidase subunit beta
MKTTADVEDLTAATYCPEEGYVDPYRLVMALVREARRQGVTVYTGTPVSDILVERGRVRGAMTNRGPIAARWVVNAAGPWARRVAWMAGVDIPVAHTKCQILAVRPHSPFPYTIPWVLDRESRFYLREDAGGVVLLGRLVQEFRADHLLDADAYVGFGGYGIQLGAAAGQMLAALVLGQQVPEELRLWSPNRVG